MLKKIGLALGGILLIGLFVVWTLVRRTEPVEGWIDSSPILGFITWALAWACVLGGGALLARVVFRRSPDSAETGDQPAPPDTAHKSDPSDQAR